VSDPATQESNPSKTLRPVGLSFASLWAGLAAGLVPLVLLLFFYFGSDGGSMTVARFTFFLVLRVSIVVFALGTWRGSSLARYALIGLVVFSYGWDAYWRYTRAVSSAEPLGISVASWARVISSIAIGGAIVGYLLFSKKAHEYFRIRHENVAS
jgi:hypothetical protein